MQDCGRGQGAEGRRALREGRLAGAVEGKRGRAGNLLLVGERVAQERLQKCADVGERTVASGVEKFIEVWARTPGLLKDSSYGLQGLFPLLGQSLLHVMFILSLEP